MGRTVGYLPRNREFRSRLPWLARGVGPSCRSIRFTSFADVRSVQKTACTRCFICWGKLRICHRRHYSAKIDLNLVLSVLRYGCSVYCSHFVRAYIQTLVHRYMCIIDRQSKQECAHELTRIGSYVRTGSTDFNDSTLEHTYSGFR
jgi:hypothetical protein